MKAVILAGGRGTRLHPYSALLPKPLMPLGDMPILELLLRQFRRSGINEIYLAVNHLSHLIQAFFGDGERFGLSIKYTREEKPLGTAGPIAAILDDLGDHFVVANGDLLTTLNMSRMIEEHVAQRPAATIGVYEREVRIDFGLVETDEYMHLTGYREKPKSVHLVSMGIYILNRHCIMRHLRKNHYLDMPTLLELLTASGQIVRCFREDCFWLDIGRPEDFARAQELFEKDRNMFIGPEA